MKKAKKDPAREDRIHNEAIADANGPEEQVMGWYYYLDDKIRFPFQASCIAPRVVSPFRKGETVEVQRMAPEDADSAAIPLRRLTERTRSPAVLPGRRGHREIGAIGARCAHGRLGTRPPWNLSGART